MSAFQESKSKLAEELRVAAEDAEEFMDASREEIAEKTHEVRVRLRGVLADAKMTCAQLEGQSLEGMRIADHVIRENPYRVIGIMVGIGFFVGVILKKRA